ncbi:MAG: 50S ribosomal protein L32e [Marine Group III euryarchaeote CG-Bathy1]|uniref:Large ribosomal subunit protein eL32 n=1 Tax=Marine Group III euryarchaeote CG-Bathy1 TaxID=1889001 RepID=A0A1J5TXL4_9ARCH|nr:MAG: 50S ribosomal protein L32e [Marine Group III euryarchaeote CG-Bathy1]
MSEENEHKAKIKPEISNETKRDLECRDEKNKGRPAFKRQNWFRYKRLGTSWRRAKGIHSKLRRGFKYRPSKVKIGFRGPKAVRGFHPSGFEEVLIQNVKDLEELDVKKHAARIASGVGLRKREMIIERANEMGLRVLNGGEE